MFPAHISDDSPWKQEASSKKLDPELEEKTQEAIDLYFSQHHTITTPEDVIPKSFAASQRSMLIDSVGNSPNFANDPSRDSQRMEEDQKVENSSSESNSLVTESSQISQSIQTWLSFPPILPTELETVLAKYGITDQSPDEGIKIICPSSKPWSSRPNIVREESQSNMSNSTLRRKLFAGMIGDDETFDSEEEEEEDGNERRNDMEDDNDEQNKENVNLKENCESTAMIVSPGKVFSQICLTNLKYFFKRSLSEQRFKK